MSKVFCMMSGGVDSSVAASLLAQQGYDVTGVFMKCWSLEQLQKLGIPSDLYGCFWEDDARDAELVAKKLSIPFEVWDLQEEYLLHVVNYMITEYRNGRTPNPDVMCNSTIKFGVFFEKAMQQGADYVATGHYAGKTTYPKTLIQTDIQPNNLTQNASKQSVQAIQKGMDPAKDQAYFLWRIQPEKISKILFPLQQFLTKSEVRAYALQHNLVTAKKPDSQGLCFIGTTPLRELLQHVYGTMPGDIVTDNWQKASQAKKLTKKDKKQFDTEGFVTIGTHPGAVLYTIGQRTNLGLSGGPWFVAKNDITHNRLFVLHNSASEILHKNQVTISSLNFQVPLDLWPRDEENNILVDSQIRYHGKIIPAKFVLDFKNSDSAIAHFTQHHTALAAGQGIVFYDNNVMLGGGIIESDFL